MTHEGLSPGSHGTPPFAGRARECRELDRMLERVRGGESAALVIRGEAGIGKTELMSYCTRQASGFRIAHVAGVESELEVPYAVLHQLCGPMLEDLANLPEPQERALQIAFGLASGNAPDRFLVGLAVLGLLAEVAAKRPLLCTIDDAQWIDGASSQILGFVGRRLLAESVLLLFAVRETADERLLPDLPALTLEGLTNDDAQALLMAAIPGQLDAQVRDRIVAETRGNPLGLLELPRGMSQAELAGGLAVPATAPLSGHLQDHYLRRVQGLPEPTQQLLLIAAADPTGDATLVWRAAQTQGVGRDAAAVAESEQLLEIGSQVRFRHPLVRSAAYAAGSPEHRSAAHLALAAATDATIDPERRLWHLAAAATEPDEDLAGDLERMASRAQARGGVAAAAAMLERSASLTAESEPRADRALASANAHLRAGAFDAARGMLLDGAAAATNDLQRARAEQLWGQIESTSNAGRDAPVRLLQAAARLKPLDSELERETYLEAWVASLIAGRHAPAGGHLVDVSEAARSALQSSQASRPRDLLLRGLATVITDGRTAAAPSLRLAVDAFLTDQASGEDWLRWGHVAQVAATLLWDFDGWATLSARHVELARASSALAPLSVALNGYGLVAAWCGDFEAVAALAAEETAVKEVTGIGLESVGALALAAYRGQPADVPLISAAASESTARGKGYAAQFGYWATAVLDNGLARHADALTAAERAAEATEVDGPYATVWVLPELIEAAVRTGGMAAAEDALERLSAATLADSDWASGIEARSRALVSEGDTAERLYAEAIERLGRTRLRPELGRAHLLYGEWLRREGRRADARDQLRTAYDLFGQMGAHGFGERARAELVSTGEKVLRREADTTHELTAQEAHIARLARDGRTNAEIGAEMFISARTVEWHLRKVFSKLGITSRKGLQQALPLRRS
jgi:DNA-binding CsgD family transcriptional regulator